MRLLFVLTPALLLTACQQSTPTADGNDAATGQGEPTVADAEADAVLPVDAAPPDPNAPVVPAPELGDLVYQDFADRIESGLSCNFDEGRGRTLFVASGPDSASARARGVVKLGNKIVLVTSTRTGGFKDLIDAPVLVGDGVRVGVTRSSAPAVPDATESQLWTAELVVAVDGGASTSVTGTWSCGA